MVCSPKEYGMINRHIVVIVNKISLGLLIKKEYWITMALLCDHSGTMDPWLFLSQTSLFGQQGKSRGWFNGGGFPKLSVEESSLKWRDLASHVTDVTEKTRESM